MNNPPIPPRAIHCMTRWAFKTNDENEERLILEWGEREGLYVYEYVGDEDGYTLIVLQDEP